MNFLSFHFLVFLAVIVGLNWRLSGHPGARKWALLAGSYYFYAAWDWRFASLLVVLTAANYTAGRGIAQSQATAARRAWLAFALLVSLGTLAAFKFADFYIAELRLLLQSLGLVGDGSLLQLILPLGISFFTFQSLSYVLDIYRRQQEACRDWRDFALFVAFFPTVLAGPITRAKQLLPQLEKLDPPNPLVMEEGFALILRGAVKKIMFADVLATQIVGPAFADPTNFSSAFLLVALYAYTFQIYMDVSGYTDIARGAAALCGIRLPENFNRPYVAATVSNFWQRWHISMSSFFRDYLYFGLGGTKRGNVYLNLMLTFLAIGIWHGAGWNFVVYGLIHGGVVCLERVHRSWRESKGLQPEVTSGVGWLLAVMLTFHIVVFSRVLFRAPDLDSAMAYMRQLLTSGSSHTGPSSFRVESRLKITGRRRARWACGQAAFEPVHMSTGRLPGERI